MPPSLATILQTAINVSSEGYEINAMKKIENDIDLNEEHILAFYRTTKDRVDRIINNEGLRHRWQIQEIMEKGSTVRECSTPLSLQKSRRVNSG
jgi:hypothetical protein